MNLINILLISLIIILIICPNIYIIYNYKRYSYYICLISDCIIISLFILVVFSCYYKHYIDIVCFNHIAKTKSERLYKYRHEPPIARYINVFSIVLSFPIIWKIFIQLKNFVKKRWSRVYLVILDILSLLLIYHIYFISDFYYLTNGYVYHLFPYVLISSVLALIPACISVYIYITTHINISKVVKFYKRDLIDICLSSLTDSLSMLGISLAFNTLVYSTRWFVSVGLIYWGSYFFMIISLTIIVLRTIRSIKYKILYPNNE